MKVNKDRLNIIMAKRCRTVSSLRSNGLSPQTVTRIFRDDEYEVRPATLGKLAKALGCDVEDIIEKEG